MNLWHSLRSNASKAATTSLTLWCWIPALASAETQAEQNTAYVTASCHTYAAGAGIRLRENSSDKSKLVQTVLFNTPLCAERDYSENKDESAWIKVTWYSGIKPPVSGWIQKRFLSENRIQISNLVKSVKKANADQDWDQAILWGERSLEALSQATLQPEKNENQLQVLSLMKTAYEKKSLAAKASSVGEQIESLRKTKPSPEDSVRAYAHWLMTDYFKHEGR